LHGHDLRFATSEFGGLQVDIEGPTSDTDEDTDEHADDEDQDDPSSLRKDSITSA
jgi:hypothetical protein